MFLSKNKPDGAPLKYGAISKEDLLNMGAENIAYIRPADFGDEKKFLVYQANGTLISEQADYQTAREELRAHNVYCATLH